MPSHVGKKRSFCNISHGEGPARQPAPTRPRTNHRFFGSRGSVAVMLLRSTHQWYLVPRDVFLRDVRVIADRMGYDQHDSLYDFLQSAPEIHDYKEDTDPAKDAAVTGDFIQRMRHLRRVESTLLARLFAGGWSAYRRTADCMMGIHGACHVIVLYANPETSDTSDDETDNDDTT